MNKDALRDYFNRVAPIRHKLGGLDCVRFVTDAVYIGWDRDYRDILQYDDRRSAVKRLRELGGLEGACTYAMGEMYHISELSAGDVVYIETPAPTLGLVMEEFVFVKMGITIHRVDKLITFNGWRT